MMFPSFFSRHTQNTEARRLLDHPKKRPKNEKPILLKPNYFFLTDEKILVNIAELLDLNSLNSFILTHKHVLHHLRKDITALCKQETFKVLVQKKYEIIDEKAGRSEDWFAKSFGIYLASRILDCLVTGAHGALNTSATKDMQLSILAPLVFQFFLSIAILQCNHACTPELSSFIRWLVGITWMLEIIAHPYVMGGVALRKDHDMTRGQVYLGVASTLDALELLFTVYLQYHARCSPEIRAVNTKIVNMREYARKHLVNPEPSAQRQATLRIAPIVDEEQPQPEGSRFHPGM